MFSLPSIADYSFRGLSKRWQRVENAHTEPVLIWSKWRAGKDDTVRQNVNALLMGVLTVKGTCMYVSCRELLLRQQ